jgi:PAS domain-containing protein
LNRKAPEAVASKESMDIYQRELDNLKAALDEHAIVAVTDPQGRITQINGKFCAISKYSREELLGQDHRMTGSGFPTREFIAWTARKLGQSASGGATAASGRH